jgi:hypothetical protein
MNLEYQNIFIKYLELLHGVIEKAEGSTLNESTILSARLVEDMFPLNVQVKIVTNFALRGCCAAVEKEFTELEADINSYAGLKRLTQHTIQYIKKLPLPTPEQKNIIAQDTAGLVNISMVSPEYVTSFVLPNFFFHISMVYAIAKRQGLPVTKGDFDGIHQYPAGFSWEN